jgi:Zn-dependent M28 family amino/carboxypeptidase
MSFDGQRAYVHVQAQCDLGPRPPGSPAAQAVGQYIAQELRGLGWQTRFQEFEYKGERLRNIIATRGPVGEPAILLGAHYDSRRRADRDLQTPNAAVVGANDGASGVAVVLELARVLGKPTRPLTLAFFDGEDQGDLNGWEWAVGATHLAANLDRPIASMVLVDMVGDADQQVYWEANSDKALRERLWGIAADLGYDRWFIPSVKHSLTDDHTPFLRRGIPAVDIIDFDYPYWHTTRDTPDKVSPDSLERVGRVLEMFLK